MCVCVSERESEVSKALYTMSNVNNNDDDDDEVLQRKEDKQKIEEIVIKENPSLLFTFWSTFTFSQTD